MSEHDWNEGFEAGQKRERRERDAAMEMLKEAQAEVERLRSCEDQHLRDLGEAAAEVERLQRLVETVDRQRIANGDEVERLREEVEYHRVNNAQYQEMVTENERLRAQVDQLAKIRGKQIPALWAENDRLRAENELLRTWSLENEVKRLTARLEAIYGEKES